MLTRRRLRYPSSKRPGRSKETTAKGVTGPLTGAVEEPRDAEKLLYRRHIVREVFQGVSLAIVVILQRSDGSLEELPVAGSLCNQTCELRKHKARVHEDRDHRLEVCNNRILECVQRLGALGDAVSDLEQRNGGLRVREGESI